MPSHALRQYRILRKFPRNLVARISLEIGYALFKDCLRMALPSQWKAIDTAARTYEHRVASALNLFKDVCHLGRC